MDLQSSGDSVDSFEWRVWDVWKWRLCGENNVERTVGNVTTIDGWNVIIIG